MIKCDKCGSPHVLSKILIHGARGQEEMNLCASCFQSFVKSHPELKQGALGRSLNQILSETLKILNSGIFESGNQTGKELRNTNISAVRQCPACSTPDIKIVKDGIAGCDYCYTFFEKEIETYLFKETGANVRMMSEKSLSRSERVKNLEERLNMAVKSENFELAAAIRDDIKSLINT
jgi:protein arginine kinase activator